MERAIWGEKITSQLSRAERLRKDWFRACVAGIVSRNRYRGRGCSFLLNFIML